MLSGIISASDGGPLVGATVIVLRNGQVLDGCATDGDGSFKLATSVPATDSLELRVSSVGYESQLIGIVPAEAVDAITITLTAKLVSVGSITVSPALDRTSRKVTLSRHIVADEAEASLVPTNPIAALKQPEISRAGSNHSSQIRVHGTSPVYYLNGLPIGTDPAHYGMFAIIPSSVVERINFHPMGTSTEHQLSSIVELNTAQPFGQESHGEVVLSTIEATGSFSIASDKVYAVGSLRKSVLDRLIRHLDISTDRTTLPPTNFQDVFGSVGFRLSNDVRLMVDHYRVQDYLSYNTGAITEGSAGINTSQSSSENMLSARLVRYSNNSLIEATAAVRSGRRQYQAQPSDNKTESVRVDISEHYTVGYTRLQSTMTPGGGKLTAGFEAEFDSPRKQSLNQRNWNFLPPFSNTDNPFVYQQALNETYDTYYSELRASSRAVYVSLATRLGEYDVETGLRYDHFKPLREGHCLTTRVSIAKRLYRGTLLRVVYGSFVSTPLDNILEPYQVLIRANLNKLTPEKTSLVSVDLTHRSLTLTLFHKRLDQLPTMVPDFVLLRGTDGRMQSDFLSVRSEGAARFCGGSIASEKIQLGRGPFSVQASYAYTQAYQIDHAMILPYELHSPHRIHIQTDYRQSRRLTVGAEFTARSGYPYSPIRSTANRSNQDIYTDSYYSSVRAADNSKRFATNAYLNLSARYEAAGVDLLLSISNVTNRANPIINASSGQIFDAGIMPMLGLKYKF